MYSSHYDNYRNTHNSKAGVVVGADMQTRVGGVNYLQGKSLTNAVVTKTSLFGYTPVGPNDGGEYGGGRLESYDRRKRGLYTTNTVMLIVTAVTLITFAVFCTLGELGSTPKSILRVPLAALYASPSGTNEITGLGTYALWPIILAELAISVLIQVFFYWNPSSMKFSWRIKRFKRVLASIQTIMRVKTSAASTVLGDYVGNSIGDESNFIEILIFSVDTVQWIVNLITVPLVFWVTAAVSGVNDVYTLGAVVAIGIWFLVTVGILHERANTDIFDHIFGTMEDSKRDQETNPVSSSTTWAYFLLGILPFVCFWIVVVGHLIAKLQLDNILSLAYVIAWDVGIFLLTVGFQAAVLVHYTSIVNLLAGKGLQYTASRPEVVDEIMYMNFLYSLTKQIIFTLIKIAPAILLIVNLYV